MIPVLTDPQCRNPAMSASTSIGSTSLMTHRTTTQAPAYAALRSYPAGMASTPQPYQPERAARALPVPDRVATEGEQRGTLVILSKIRRCASRQLRRHSHTRSSKLEPDWANGEQGRHRTARTQERRPARPWRSPRRKPASQAVPREVADPLAADERGVRLRKIARSRRDDPTAHLRTTGARTFGLAGSPAPVCNCHVTERCGTCAPAPRTARPPDETGRTARFLPAAGPGEFASTATDRPPATEGSPPPSRQSPDALVEDPSAALPGWPEQ